MANLCLATRLIVKKMSAIANARYSEKTLTD